MVQCVTENHVCLHGKKTDGKLHNPWPTFSVCWESFGYSSIPVQISISCRSHCLQAAAPPHLPLPWWRVVAWNSTLPCFRSFSISAGTHFLETHYYTPSLHHTTYNHHHTVQVAQVSAAKSHAEYTCKPCFGKLERASTHYRAKYSLISELRASVQALKDLCFHEAVHVSKVCLSIDF